MNAQLQRLELPDRDLHALLMPLEPSKDEKHRVNKFIRWMDATGRPWHTPDLDAYRDYMQAQTVTRKGPEGEPVEHPRYSALSVSAHLSSIRARYQQLAIDNGLRQAMFEYIAEQAPEATPADRKAFVDETYKRLENGLDPKAAKVDLETVQDVTADAHLRLTKAQANALLAAPGIGSLMSLRDTAMIAVMLCTAVREAELVGLEVQDLRQRMQDGELALHVRKGKGRKTRLIPYGEMSWCLVVVDKWMKAAGITSGRVFRSFYRGGRKTRPGGMTTRAVQQMLDRYPISIEGKLVCPRPHDCRRTYARLLWEAGVAPIAVQQNLGHADLKTTLHYIGILSGEQRRPPSVYQFDLAALERLPV
jgi:integrase